MDALRAATDDEVLQMPRWLYTFWRSMCKEGRKEETAKSYASTFKRLFEEDRKAPAEMASQTYFDLTKASPKNKSGNGQRSASVAAFKKFYQEIQGDVTKLDEPDQDAKFCQVNVNGELRPYRGGRKVETNGEQEPKGRKRKVEKSNEDHNGKPKDRAKPKKEKIKVEKGDNLQRKTVSLKRAFELLTVAAGTGPNMEFGRPRAVHVHGRDANKRMAHRIHGLYTERKDELKGGKPVFEKADYERRTYILFSEEKKTWRMSVSMDQQGDFAKVKEPVALPWKVTKPWRVFSDSNSYEEDPELRCDYLDPLLPLPDAEVEVCLPMCSEDGTDVPGGELETRTSSSSQRNLPGRTGDRALLISGLEDSIKNSQRIMGVYEEQGEHNGRPIFVKEDKAKPSVLFFHAEKDKWRIAKSISERGDFAHVKNRAPLPWQVQTSWKVFDGESYKEVQMLVEARQPATKKGPEAMDQKRPDTDEIPLDLLPSLPKDAPPKHAAYVAVKWEAPKRRAFFYFNGVHFQVVKARARSQASAMLIARACYVKLLNGCNIDEAINFRDVVFQQIRENPKAGDTEDEESLESDKPPSKKARKSGARSGSASGSSFSSSSGSDSSEESQASDAGATEVSAGGWGHFQKDMPHQLGRVCAKMAARSGLRCFRCFLHRRQCQCKDLK